MLFLVRYVIINITKLNGAIIMKSVCFTGHRTAEMSGSLEKRLTDTLEILISKGITDFYAGRFTSQK